MTDARATPTAHGPDLRDVYWIGGGSGGGKSTVARRIAERHGLRVYSTDDVMGDHASRCSPEDCPHLHSFISMNMDERWVNCSPEVMLETFHWFRGEGFGLIVEDLRKIPSHERIVVEGFRLLPDLVKPHLNEMRQGVWLIPTPAFRLSAFESRGTLWDMAGRTSDPARALANLLERDRLFSERTKNDVRRLEMTMIEVDSSTSESELVDRVEKSLGLA